MYRRNTANPLFSLVLLVTVAWCLGCKHAETPDSAGVLNLSKTTVSFPSSGGASTIEVESSSQLSITNTPEWLTSETSKGLIELTATPNLEKQSRTATLTVSNAERLTKSMKVVQLGSEQEILVNGEKSYSHTYSSSDALDFSVTLSHNTPYTVSLSDESGWLKHNAKLRAGSEMIDTEESFSIQGNKSGKERTCVITFTSTENEKVTAKATIIQRSGDDNVQDVEIVSDTKLTVTGGKDTDHNGNQTIALTYDGDLTGANDHHYHSNWDASVTQFPVTLEYEFTGNTLPLDYIIYHSRNGNGNFGKFELFVLASGESEYKKIGDYDFGQAGGSVRLDLPEPIIPEKVKFVLQPGLGGFVSCAEMEFFHILVDPLNAKLAKVFTDLSCMEVRAEATEEDIEALPAYFASLARTIKNGGYPEEEKRYRMGIYSAQSIPERWAQKLIINSYSHLNSPTGIITNPMETILIMVDGIEPGYGASLLLNGDNAPGGLLYALKNGVNKITVGEGGNLFIQYEVDDPRTAPQIKVHFPPQSNGEKQVAQVGYNLWDINVDKTDDSYRALLPKAKSYTFNNKEQCIFIVKGNRFVLTADVILLQNQERLKGYGMTGGVERWDNVMMWEQELSAMDDFIKSGEFTNLMHIMTRPSEGLNASQYRIQMDSGTDLTRRDDWGYKNMFQPQDMDMAQDNQWGPAHELGHMHQGAINWASTMESSNNLFSNYVVYNIDKWGSRGSSIEKLATYRYAPATPWVRFGHPRKAGSTTEFDPHDMQSGDDNKNGLYQGEDSEMHMRMNQQLWTYFDRIGKKPGTIRKIFQLCRGAYSLQGLTPGQAQLRYAEAVAEAAQMDMTEFFDAWGFFIPVKSFRLLAYGAHQYEVTEQMIAETKAFMKKYPVKCPPIQYIEDRQYETGATGNPKGRSENGGDVGYFTTFQNNIKITKTPTYINAGREFQIDNGDEAVAFELKDADGRTIWFSNRFRFAVPEQVNLTGNYRLYAVQSDGTRIEIRKQ